MTHLSLITLPNSSTRWRYLQPYDLHQVLWKGFPNLKRGNREERFLYRHDELDTSHSILVQSMRPPDWTFLEDEAEGTVIVMRTFDPTTVKNGTRLRFLLRANPTVFRKGYDDGKQRRIPVGSRMDLVANRLNVKREELPSREEKQIEWMERKAAENGFAVIACLPGDSREYVIRRSAENQDKKSKPMTFTGVDFEGILRVTDSERFAAGIRMGIGRGRAFGFGLLSVARPM